MVLLGSAAGWSTLARGEVTTNGTMLTIKSPAPNFIASLPPLSAYPPHLAPQAHAAFTVYLAQAGSPTRPLPPGFPTQTAQPTDPVHSATGMPPTPYTQPTPPR